MKFFFFTGNSVKERAYSKIEVTLLRKKSFFAHADPVPGRLFHKGFLLLKALYGEVWKAFFGSEGGMPAL